MENIDQVRDEFHRILEEVQNIYERLFVISDFIKTIEEGDAKITQLRNIFRQIERINLRLRELVETNRNYTTITQIYDDNGVQSEINLFYEITVFLEPSENMYLEKSEVILGKIEELRALGNARIIPSTEEELIPFNEQIINQSTCSMCMERVVNIRIDCGHLFCSNCVINIIECPLCRNEITSFAKIYLKKYLKYRTKYMLLKKKLAFGWVR